MLRRILLTLLLLCCASASAAAPAVPDDPHWEPWSEDVFQRAAREHRFVLMDLEAVWCHWCHVMSETTYRDPEVRALIASRYIAVRVDQDSRPDISRRYEQYGWPATVVFNADGTEIVKRRGYIPPELMTSMLKAIIVDPSPVKYQEMQEPTQFAASPLLDTATRTQLEKSYYATYDPKLGAFRQNQKFIDRDTIEYGLLRASQGGARATRMTKKTLDEALQLVDPVWGGAYQYSTDGDWRHPHYEKIMSVQAADMHAYTLAYLEFHDARYLAAARAIARYVHEFLTAPDGALYTSQDADLVRGEHSAAFFALNDAERRKQGIPRIDRNSYARENGWMIQSLAALYAASGQREYLDSALSAADWICANRALSGGGFAHSAKDAAGPYLEDTLSMGRAFLALYEASADRKWLARAEGAANFIDAHFRDAAQPGYVSAASAPQSKLKPVKTQDENIQLVLFGNLLARYSGVERYRQSAEYAMRYLATPQVALSALSNPGVLEAAQELAIDPTHLTIVARKDDPQAAALFRAALVYPAAYRRIEWWDTREGRMPNADVQYPQLSRAAAFVCTNNTCSLPIFDTAGIAALARSTSGPAQSSPSRPASRPGRDDYPPGP
jgi:uncharacterized protein YyaL (SSP411 family)